MKSFSLKFTHYIKQDKKEDTVIISGINKTDAMRSFIIDESSKYDFFYIISVNHIT